LLGPAKVALEVLQFALKIADLPFDRVDAIAGGALRGGGDRQDGDT
jgi:hypothetical protein